MIKKVYIENDILEDDYYNFMNLPIIKKELYKLDKNQKNEYIIALDIAGRNSKDCSCMTYFQKSKNGNLIFKGTKLINKK